MSLALRSLGAAQLSRWQVTVPYDLSYKLGESRADPASRKNTGHRP
ncbi:MAG: hypothetical protein QOD94_2451 [Alphaproteobacteria bacterium]|jgi:hypothetical protein|nr:hypothetical protein [Alphaproteobacteria bacterium]